MKINHPDCRVWSASAALREVLPPANGIDPHPTSDMQPIDVYKTNGLSWIASKTCAWHSDWQEMFCFLVVRGSAMFYLGHAVDGDGSTERKTTKVIAKCRIRRGDIIQLWPMRYHRVTVDQQLSAIEHPMGNVERRCDAFMYSRPVMEGVFYRKILDKYEGPCV
jgi:hypothetical protein